MKRWRWSGLKKKVIFIIRLHTWLVNIFDHFRQEFQVSLFKMYHFFFILKENYIYFIFLISFFKFYFIFTLYNIVLVLPNIEMNLPQVYLCSPSWTLLPPPSPYPSHPSAPARCTTFESIFLITPKPWTYALKICCMHIMFLGLPWWLRG